VQVNKRQTAAFSLSATSPVSALDSSPQYPICCLEQCGNSLFSGLWSLRFVLHRDVCHRGPDDALSRSTHTED
jgi:hypothetical protein